MSTPTIEDGRRTDGYVRTFTGLKFFLSNPTPDSICIEDQAHSLANICRFTGHTRTFYSVAQHAVYVSWLCPPKHVLWGLLHESEEPYFQDLSTVAKRLPGMEAYRAYGKHTQRLAAIKFGLPPDEPTVVKDVDDRLLVTEQRDLMHGTERSSLLQPLPLKIKPWSPKKSERVFLLRYAELTGAPLKWYQRVYLKFVRGRW